MLQMILRHTKENVTSYKPCDLNLKELEDDSLEILEILSNVMWKIMVTATNKKIKTGRNSYRCNISSCFSFGSNPNHSTSCSTAAQAMRTVVNVAAHCPDGETAIAPPAPWTRSPMVCRESCEASDIDLPVTRGGNMDLMNHIYGITVRSCQSTACNVMHWKTLWT